MIEVVFLSDLGEQERAIIAELEEGSVLAELKLGSIANPFERGEYGDFDIEP